MAGLDDLMSESGGRWARAERHAHGFADNGMGEALRIYYTRYFPAGLALYVVAVVVLSFLLSGEGPIDWRFVVQGAAPAFGLLAGGAGSIYNAKKLRPRAQLGSNMAVVLPLEKEEQKYLRRVTTGREAAPRDPVRLTVARSVAIQNRKGLATNLLIAPLNSLCIGGIVGPLSIIWIILSAVFLVTTIVFVHEFIRLGRFLTATEP